MCGETQSVVAVPHPAWARRQYILDHVVQVNQSQLYEWVNQGRVRIWKGSGDPQRSTCLFSVADVIAVVEADAVRKRAPGEVA